MDPGLLEHLADGGQRGLLSRLGDPAHDRPQTVVAAPPEQEPAVLVDDHGADPGQPQQVMAQAGSQCQDEVGDRHVPERTRALGALRTSVLDTVCRGCLLYTSDAADEEDSVD